MSDGHFRPGEKMVKGSRFYGSSLKDNSFPVAKGMLAILALVARALGEHPSPRKSR
jgi:hypothetical protein